MLTEFQKKMRIRSRIMLAVMLVSFCFISMPMTVYADPGSWTGTYTGTVGTLSSGSDEFKNPFDDDLVQQSENNWINKLLGKVVAISGTGIEYAFNYVGISVDSVILGRQASGGNSYSIGSVKNPFHFELAEGNVYGYTSAVAYAVLRQLISIFMAIVFMMELAKCGLSLNGADKQRLKDYTVHFTFIFMLLYLMPNIVDLFVYVRSVALHKIATTLAAQAGSFSITQNMYSAFQADPSLITGCLYLASVGLLIYMMALYVGNALTCTVLFAFFPLVGILSVKDRGLLGAWLKQMIGTLFVPLFDGVLLFIPAMFFKYTTSYVPGGSSTLEKAWTKLAIYLIGMVMCFFIIPARKIILNSLGLGSVGAGENVGLQAMGAAMSAAGATASALRNHSKAKKEAKADREDAMKEADKEDDRANTEEAIGKLNDTVEGSGKGAMDTNTALNKFENESANDNAGGSKGADSSATNTTDDAAENIQPSKSGAGISGAAADAPTSGGEATPGGTGSTTSAGDDIKHEDTIHNDQAPQPAAVNADNIAPQSGMSAREANLNDIDQSNRDIASARDNIREAKTDNANLKRDIEGLALENNKIDKAVADGAMTKDDATAKKAANNLAISEKKLQMAKNDGLINDAQQVMENAKERRDNAISNERAFASEDKSMGGTGRTYRSMGEFQAQQSKSKAIADMANHKNFDSPMFEGHLSASEKATFRRQRAAEMRSDANKEYRQKINESRAQMVGSLAGGLVGGSAMLMTGQAVKGAEVGSNIGSNIPSAVADTAYNVADDIKNRDYSKAEAYQRKAAVVQVASNAMSKAQNSSIKPVAVVAQSVGNSVGRVTSGAKYLSNNAATGTASVAQNIAQKVSEVPVVNKVANVAANAATKHANDTVYRNANPEGFYKAKQEEYYNSGTNKRLEREGYNTKFVNASGINSNIQTPTYTSNVVLSEAGKEQNMRNFMDSLPSEMRNDSAFEIYGSAGGRYQQAQELARNGDIDGARREMESLYTDYMNSNPEQN